MAGVALGAIVGAMVPLGLFLVANLATLVDIALNALRRPVDLSTLAKSIASGFEAGISESRK